MPRIRLTMTTPPLPDAPVNRWTYDAYKPEPRQWLAHQIVADEILYGGSAGGGKTEWLIAEALRVTLLYGFPSLILRRTLKELKQPTGIISRMLLRIPPTVGHYNGTEHTWYFKNGGTIQLGYLENDKDLQQYMGAEYAFIGWDQVEHFTEYQFERMHHPLRVSETHPGYKKAVEDGFSPFMGASANPGGIGHVWVKSRFIDPAPPETVFADPNWEQAFDDPQDRATLRAFIPAKVTDNRYLRNTPYMRTLNALPETERKALRDGDWDVFVGQMFKQFRRDVHVVEPEDYPIPLGGVTKVMGVDYGTTNPFAAHWIAIFPDDLFVVYRELYKTDLTAKQQARAILDAELVGERREGRQAVVYLDPSCWARGKDSPVPMGNKDIPVEGSIAYDYRAAGLPIQRANNDRLTGIRVVKDALDIRRDGRPRLLIYNTCTNLIRTLPALIRDKLNVEDVDTHGEDHCYAGSTLVETSDGPRRIDQMVGTEGLAIGPAGRWVPYFDVRSMGVRPTLKVTLEDGRSLQVTANHKVLTPTGWTQAGALLPGDLVHSVTWTQRWLAQRSRNMPASGITSAIGISNTKANVSIDEFGSMLTGPFPMITTFITKMKTVLITACRIFRQSSVWITSASTRPIPARNKGQHGGLTRSITRALAMLNSPRSSEAQLPPRAGSASKRLRSGVLNVASRSQLRSPVEPSSAVGPAVPATAVVKDVRPGPTVEVFDLAIESADHAFAVNGGIISSNSYDALRYALMGARKAPRPESAGDRIRTNAGQTLTGDVGNRPF